MPSGPHVNASYVEMTIETMMEPERRHRKIVALQPENRTADDECEQPDTRRR
jgi:hypothetical protein